MTSRGFITTLTGLLASAAASVALAQPAAPVPAPGPAPKPAAVQPAPRPAPAPAVVPSTPSPQPAPWPGIDHAEIARAVAEAQRTLESFQVEQVSEAVERAREQQEDHIERAREQAERQREAMEHLKERGSEAGRAQMERHVESSERQREIMEREVERATSHAAEIAERMARRHEDHLVASIAEDVHKSLMKAKAGAFGLGKAEKLGQAQAARLFEKCDNWRGDADEAEDRFYDCGRRALDESQFERAADYFARAAGTKGTRADGALYWKAYAQNRLGQRAEALATLAELKTGHAKSRWTNDAGALEVEIRQRSGQKVEPANTADDELKLLALQALGDSPDAVPMLERLLQGPQSPKLKERALFVLAQNQNPAARQVVAKVATGGANPELQLKAVQYLGQFRTPESRDTLAQVYASSTDPVVKRSILRSYMVSEDRARLLAAARSETNQELRVEAVRQLGNMRAVDELAELYGRESSPDVKKQIIRSLANGGSMTRLIALVQTEQNAELKRTGIRTLGVNRAEDTATHLVSFYEKDTTPEVREAVIDALFVQNNAAALVTLARKEKNPDLRKALVRKLAVMKNKEATDYMLELLK